MVIVSKFEKNTKDEGGNGNGNNGNGGDASEDKTIKVNGEGGLKITLESEGEVSQLTTTNYQATPSGNMADITWDIEAIIGLKNSAEVEVEDAEVISVEEQS